MYLYLGSGFVSSASSGEPKDLLLGVPSPNDAVGVIGSFLWWLALPSVRVVGGKKYFIQSLICSNFIIFLISFDPSRPLYHFAKAITKPMIIIKVTIINTKSKALVGSSKGYFLVSIRSSFCPKYSIVMGCNSAQFCTSFLASPLVCNLNFSLAQIPNSESVRYLALNFKKYCPLSNIFISLVNVERAGMYRWGLYPSHPFPTYTIPTRGERAYS